jgi:hypothetical protein
VALAALPQIAPAIFARPPVELAQPAMNVFEIERLLLGQDTAHIFEVARAAGKHFVDDQVL